jgi:MFS transporter, DHA1 family, tetracycline resistance protein
MTQVPNSATASSSAAKKAAMPFIMFTVLIDMMAIGLMIPVLPALVGTFTNSQADQAFWFGAATFSFSLANFIASPLLGGLSDRYGRRPVLLLGFFALALSFFVTALATALWMVILVRVISGGMQSNISVANAYVADISAPEERAKRFGMLGAMFGVGFILGPVLGGILGAVNLQLPFWVAGVLALVNLLYGYFVLPESLPADKRRAMSWKSFNPFISLYDLSQLKGVGMLVVVLIFNGLAQFTLYTTWVLYTTFKFGWGPAQNGWSLFAVGLVSAVVQGLLLGRLLKRFSAQRLAFMGLASSMLAYLGWGLSTESWMIFAVILVNLLGATVSATLQSIISNAADATTQGKTMGAVSSLNSLMAVIAPLIGAPLLAMVSHLPKGDWRIGTPFFFCAALQLTALVLAWVHFRAVRRRQDAASVASTIPVFSDS